MAGPISTVRGTLMECIGCGQRFRGVTTFDAHRVGPYDYCLAHNPDDLIDFKHRENAASDKCRWGLSRHRRCLTELELKGLMELDETGAWARWRPRT